MTSQRGRSAIYQVRSSAVNEMDALSRMRDWVPVRVTVEEAVLRTAIGAENVPPAPGAAQRCGPGSAWCSGRCQ
jgi:hypothetical protein